MHEPAAHLPRVRHSQLQPCAHLAQDRRTPAAALLQSPADHVRHPVRLQRQRVDQAAVLHSRTQVHDQAVFDAHLAELARFARLPVQVIPETIQSFQIQSDHHTVVTITRHQILSLKILQFIWNVCLSILVITPAE